MASKPPENAVEQAPPSADRELEKRQRRLAIIWDEFPGALRAIVKAEGMDPASNFMQAFWALREGDVASRVRWLLTESLLKGTRNSYPPQAPALIAASADGIPYLIQLITSHLTSHAARFPQSGSEAKDILISVAGDADQRANLAPLLERLSPYYGNGRAERRGLSRLATDSPLDQSLTCLRQTTTSRPTMLESIVGDIRHLARHGSPGEERIADAGVTNRRALSWPDEDPWRIDSFESLLDAIESHKEPIPADDAATSHSARATVVLAENFDQTLAGLGPAGQRSLRAHIENQDNIPLIATTTRLSDAWRAARRSCRVPAAFPGPRSGGNLAVSGWLGRASRGERRPGSARPSPARAGRTGGARHRTDPHIGAKTQKIAESDGDRELGRCLATPPAGSPCDSSSTS
jgi:hypothetical protein